jgi:hypothetical protein
MTRTLRLAIGVVLATPVFVGMLAAQSNLSTQGYGFPTGQLVTRVMAVGGSTAEIDPTTPLNPASIGLLTTRTALFQIEPEYRVVTSSTGSDHTTIDRYPVIFVGVPSGERWVTSVSSSTFLDRSWTTASNATERVGTDSVSTTFRESSNGAMNDVRLAEAWSNRSWLYIGVGLHGITGRNVTASGQDFSDTTFGSFTTTRTISYSGSAVSGGVQLVAPGQAMFGVTYRLGGMLRARIKDSLLAEGRVPNQFGVSAAYTGIPGSIFAIRAAHDAWSSMSAMLTSPTEKAHDSWDLGAGAEVPGPHLGSQTLALRAGVRSRTLPFEAGGSVVTEKSASVGSGLTFSGGRMTTDVTAVRQWRSSDLPSVTERAWTLSFSLTVRP